ncbi:MAG: protein kinase [Planctomycetaceae bacterium]
MPFRNVDELARRIVATRLAAPERVDEARARIGRKTGTPDQLLSTLLESGDLTSYQVARLKKGSTDGLVLGGCKLLYRNASGSFARVYRGASIADGRMLAVKVLRQRWADDKQTVALFRREAEIGRKLKHPNIVPIYDVGSEGEFHYFTMEFVEGGNLRDFINVRGKLAPLEATRYVRDMAEALEYALGQGVTHRDLKMTNVLMSSGGVASLIDFGLAGDEKVLGRIAGKEMQRALEYVTLEYGTGAPQDDPRSDLYFLGAIYYQLVSGQPAYPSTKIREERMQISRYRNIPPIRSVTPELPGCVVDIVSRLMQIDPQRRYQTPAHALMDLRAAIAQLETGGHAAFAAPAPPAFDAAPVADADPPSDSPTVRAGDPNLPTVMCIEDRIKQQDMLRDYLSRHGFRVLVVGDVQRGLARLKTSPPDCIVMMGGSLGDGIVAAFGKAVRDGESNGTAAIAVLAEEQTGLRQLLPAGDIARVLVQPIKLRDLRREIHLVMQTRRKRAVGPETEPDFAGG